MYCMTPKDVAIVIVCVMVVMIIATSGTDDAIPWLEIVARGADFFPGQ